MITVLYQFPRSTNQQELDDFLAAKLLPGLKGVEDLNSLQMSSGDLMSAGGPPPVSKVVQAFFPSLEALFGYVQSPVGLATQEFLEETGTLIVFFEVEEL